MSASSSSDDSIPKTLQNLDNELGSTARYIWLNVRDKIQRESQLRGLFGDAYDEIKDEIEKGFPPQPEEIAIRDMANSAYGRALYNFQSVLLMKLEGLERSQQEQKATTEAELRRLALLIEGTQEKSERDQKNLSMAIIQVQDCVKHSQEETSHKTAAIMDKLQTVVESAEKEQKNLLEKVSMIQQMATTSSQNIVEAFEKVRRDENEERTKIIDRLDKNSENLRNLNELVAETTQKNANIFEQQQSDCRAIQELRDIAKAVAHEQKKLSAEIHQAQAETSQRTADILEQQQSDRQAIHDLRGIAKAAQQEQKKLSADIHQAQTDMAQQMAQIIQQQQSDFEITRDLRDIAMKTEQNQKKLPTIICQAQEEICQETNAIMEKLKEFSHLVVGLKAFTKSAEKQQEILAEQVSTIQTMTVKEPKMLMDVVRKLQATTEAELKRLTVLVEDHQRMTPTADVTETIQKLQRHEDEERARIIDRLDMNSENLRNLHHLVEDTAQRTANVLEQQQSDYRAIHELHVLVKTVEQEQRKLSSEIRLVQKEAERKQEKQTEEIIHIKEEIRQKTAVILEKLRTDSQAVADLKAVTTVTVKEQKKLMDAIGQLQTETTYKTGRIIEELSGLLQGFSKESENERQKLAREIHQIQEDIGQKTAAVLERFRTCARAVDELKAITISEERGREVSAQQDPRMQRSSNAFVPTINVLPMINMKKMSSVKGQARLKQIVKEAEEESPESGNNSNTSGPITKHSNDKASNCREPCSVFGENNFPSSQPPEQAIETEESRADHPPILMHASPTTSLSTSPSRTTSQSGRGVNLKFKKFVGYWKLTQFYKKGVEQDISDLAVQSYLFQPVPEGVMWTKYERNGSKWDSIILTTDVATTNNFKDGSLCNVVKFRSGGSFIFRGVSYNVAGNNLIKDECGYTYTFEKC